MTINTEDTALVAKFIRSYFQAPAPDPLWNYLMSLLRIQNRFNLGAECQTATGIHKTFGVRYHCFKFELMKLPSKKFTEAEIDSFVAFVRPCRN